MASGSLARQAKELVAEAEEDNLVDKFNERWERWNKCSLCERNYHGVVRYALGWACWKTYVGRREEDPYRNMAMYRLGVALHEIDNYEAALAVFTAHLDCCRRVYPGYNNGITMCSQMSMGNCYASLGRLQEAIEIHRAYYKSAVDVWGIEQEDTLIGALGIASTLGNLGRYGEIKSFLPKNISAARSSLGVENSTTLQLTNAYARALADGGASLHDLREAVTTFEDIKETSNRVLGMDHPLSCEIQGNLERARKKLTGAEETSGSN